MTILEIIIEDMKGFYPYITENNNKFGNYVKKQNIFLSYIFFHC